jgi:hypothetical protein
MSSRSSSRFSVDDVIQIACKKIFMNEHNKTDVNERSFHFLAQKKYAKKGRN